MGLPHWIPASGARFLRLYKMPSWWVPTNLRPTMPTFFVGSGGTLRAAWISTVTSRAEAYDHLIFGWEQSPARLAGAMASCPPLAWTVQALYNQARIGLKTELEALTATRHHVDAEIRELGGQLQKLPGEPEEGVEAWVRSLPRSEFDRCIVPSLKAWEAKAPDSSHEADYLPDSSCPWNAALEYFRDELVCDPEDLGVELIEEEGPWSSYSAAELAIPIKDANARARRLKLDIEFVPED